jgi:hypothetical protein
MRHWFLVSLIAVCLTRLAAADSVELTVHTDPTTKTISTALNKGETYTLSFYARGNGNGLVTFQEGQTSVFSNTTTGLTTEWQKFTIEFTAPTCSCANRA